MKNSLLVLLLIFGITSCQKKETTTQEIPAEKKIELVELSTNFGTMTFYLYENTPLHKANFLKLNREKFFDSTTFHRLVNNFVIQGGDPNSKDSIPENDGNGGPGYTIPIELNDSIKHIRGAIGAARMGDAENPLKASNGSQFYICLSTNQTQHLNANYTVFGFVIKGMDVADKIVVQSKNSAGRPLKPIRMWTRIVEKTAKEIEQEYNYVPKF